MSAQPSATSAAIVPFWNRLPAVMLYPAHAGALATIVLLALANLLLFIPLLGWILMLLAAVAMYRYGFECLRATADGYLEPPQVGMSVDRSLGWKLIGLMIILGLVAAFGMALLGPVLGTILLLFLGMSLPGATMTLAMEESLTSALNPIKWIAIFTSIGWPYLAVVGLCIVIGWSQGYAAQFVAHLVPVYVAVVLVGIIGNYALVMTFHLMGYLIYQYHEELGFVPAAPQLARQMAQSDPDQGTLDQAVEHVRDGKPEEAVELLREHLRRGAGQSVHAQYRKLLLLTDNKVALLEHDRDYINTLMDEEKDHLAVKFLCECQAIDPAFAPSTAFQITQLAHIAAKMGQPQAALQLISVFNQRFSKNQYSVDNDLLAATLMHEHLNQDEQALALLKHLKATVPSDPLMPEVDAKIALIERMLAATKKPAPAQP